MTQEFLGEFPALWDVFEHQLKGNIVKWLMEAPNEDNNKSRLSSLYQNTGFPFWLYSTGAGFCWKERLEEVFFETRHYGTINQLYEYCNLDSIAAPHIENAKDKDAEEIYAIAVKPFLDIKKQVLMETFADMAKELDAPQPYMLNVPLEEQKSSLKLGFQKRYKKRNIWKGLDGYTYSFNDKIYTDVRAFQTRTIERLSDDVSIARDMFGNMVLRRHTEIPTFDSGDREWDSAETEYLMFDGKDIHLIIMRGGHRIAYLTFYEKLLTADARMKPVFEKLGWPRDGIMWT